MGFNQFSFFFILLLTVASCSTLKIDAKGNKQSAFSAEERNRILDGSADEPMRVYKITNRSDSLLLRKASRDVDFAKDTLVLGLFIKRLKETVVDPKSMGVGIAAPQVGVLSNIIWLQRFDKEGFPWECIINPKIITYSDEKQVCPEGCLSIPEKTAITKNRSKTIIVKYQDIDGNEIQEEVSDFTSVIFQHEIDHLNGILFIDHLEKELSK